MKASKAARIALALCFATLIACGSLNPEHGGEISQSSLSLACDANLQKAYARTYFPFLSNKCASCHANAHGSSNVTVSYNAFMERGSNLIDYQATHAHGGNNLNPAETQPMIDGFKPAFVTAQSEYLACVVQSSGGLNGSKFQLASKVIPNLMSTATNSNWLPVEWDLENESAVGDSNGLYQAIFRVEARVHLVNGAIQGINFRNPSLRLKTGSQNVEVKALSIMINGDQQNLVTTYSTVNIIVNSASNTALVANAGSALAYFPSVNATTRVGFLFEYIKNTTQQPTTDTPPTVPIIPVPIADVPIPAGGATFTQLTANAGQYRVFARSCVGCHNGGNMSGGLNLTDYSAASLKSTSIISRMNNSAMPMPPSGILRQNDRDLVQSWVDNGLKN